MQPDQCIQKCHTQMGPSISWDHTTVPQVMLCSSSNAKGVAKDLMLVKWDRSCKRG